MRVRETSAMPVGLRSRVPMKITSSMRAPRRLLADCSPRTHEIASEMLDLPQPLGPTIAATPSPWNFSSVRSQKDLNPRICSFLSFSKTHSFDPVPAFRLSGASQSRVHLRLEQGHRAYPRPFAGKLIGTMYLLSYCQSSTQPQYMVHSLARPQHIAREMQQPPAWRRTYLIVRVWKRLWKTAS